MTVVMTGRSVLVGLMYYLHAGMTRLGLSWTPHPTLRRPWTLRSLSLSFSWVSSAGVGQVRRWPDARAVTPQANFPLRY